MPSVGEEESDAMIVAMKPANKARGTVWRKRSVAPEGKSNPTHTDAEPDFVCHMGWSGYGYGLVSRPINVMRGGAT